MLPRPLSQANIAQTILFLLGSCMAHGAEYSYDGNRWYEIEISVFDNQLTDVADTELWLSENLDLSYPQEIVHLSQLTDVLVFELETVDEGPNPRFGYPVQPAQAADFRFPDFAKDSFLMLSNKSYSFDNINRRLQNSTDHRLLFHGIWRQPMLAKAQSKAIVVQGGTAFGNHHELEGSISFALQGNFILLDANLWLSQFVVSNQANEGPWVLPEPPVNSSMGVDDGAEPEHGFTPNYSVARIVQLKQKASMYSNELHYLDHPLFGVVARVKRYQLPSPFEEEFLEPLPEP